jgi:hypothetical protein
VAFERRAKHKLQRKFDRLIAYFGGLVSCTLPSKPKSHRNNLVNEADILKISDAKILSMMEDELLELRRELEGLDGEIVKGWCDTIVVSTPPPLKRSSKQRADCLLLEDGTRNCGACVTNDDVFTDDGGFMEWEDSLVLENMGNEEEWLVKAVGDVKSTFGLGA